MPLRAGREHERVVARAQLVERHVAADVDAERELDALGARAASTRRSISSFSSLKSGMP